MTDFFEKAKKFADEHEEQVEGGVERAGDEIDERTGNKYDKQIDQGVTFAEEHIGDGEPEK